MRAIAVMLVTGAALVSTADLATARDGCGAGRYFNGYRCVSMGYNYNYAPAPAYRVPRQYIGNGMVRDAYGNVGCARPGFTVQSGVCKPYRGY